MEVNIVFNESLCQDFVILPERSLGDDGLNVLVAEALWTFNACNASMAGINVSYNVPVEALLTGIGIVVVLATGYAFKGCSLVQIAHSRTLSETA
jgi:hypothetical protein